MSKPHEMEQLTAEVDKEDEVPDPSQMQTARSETYRMATTPRDVGGEEDDNVALVNPATLHGRLTWPLFVAIFACTFGSSFQFGYNIGVVNTPELEIRQWINESYTRNHDGEPMSAEDITFTWSTIVSVFSIGGMIGGLGSGWLADTMGRKGGMLFNNVFAIAGAVLLGAAQYCDMYYMLVLGRIVIGFNCGLNSGLAPIYLTEVSPVNLRGAIGSVHQLVVTISILVAQIVGLNNIFGNATYWPLAFGLTGAPAILQLILLPFCPESPKYNLIVKENEDQTVKDLRKLRQREDVGAEMSAMKIEAAHAKAVKAVSWQDMFKFPLRWPLMIAMAMMLSQQFSGINAAMFYSSNIFRASGLSIEGAKYATLAMGAMNVGMTVVSVLIIERFGRRALHMSGLMGMALTTALIAIFMTLQEEGYQWASYLCVAAVLGFVVAFATGPGSIPWFYVSELFRQNARGRANSLAVGINWTATFIIGITFLPLKDLMNQYCFLLFTGANIFFCIFTYVFAPETKGAPVESIVQRFENKQYRA